MFGINLSAAGAASRGINDQGNEAQDREYLQKARGFGLEKMQAESGLLPAETQARQAELGVRTQTAGLQSEDLQDQSAVRQGLAKARQEAVAAGRQERMSPVDAYIKHYLPRAQQVYLNSNQPEKAKAIDEYLRSEEGKKYLFAWDDYNKSVALGDTSGAAKKAEAMWNSMPGLNAKVTVQAPEEAPATDDGLGNLSYRKGYLITIDGPQGTKTLEKTPEEMQKDLQGMSVGMLSPDARAQATALSSAANLKLQGEAAIAVLKSKLNMTEEQAKHALTSGDFMMEKVVVGDNTQSVLQSKGVGPDGKPIIIPLGEAGATHPTHTTTPMYPGAPTIVTQGSKVGEFFPGKEARPASGGVLGIGEKPGVPAQGPSVNWAQPQGAAPAGTPAAGPAGSPAGMPAGAKQAPDGNWYQTDPQRPGKYLQVVPDKPAAGSAPTTQATNVAPTGAPAALGPYTAAAPGRGATGSWAAAGPAAPPAKPMAGSPVKPPDKSPVSDSSQKGFDTIPENMGPPVTRAGDMSTERAMAGEVVDFAGRLSGALGEAFSNFGATSEDQSKRLSDQRSERGLGIQKSANPVPPVTAPPGMGVNPPGKAKPAAKAYTREYMDNGEPVLDTFPPGEKPAFKQPRSAVPDDSLTPEQEAAFMKRLNAQPAAPAAKPSVSTKDLETQLRDVNRRTHTAEQLVDQVMQKNDLSNIDKVRATRQRLRDQREELLGRIRKVDPARADALVDELKIRR